jgi:hypothetical protein
MPVSKASEDTRPRKFSNKTNMTKTLQPYVNQHNESYSITLHYPIVPKEADYWGYYYEITGPMGLKNAFKGVILKNIVSTQEEADLVAESGILLDDLKGLLELSKGGCSPITLPDLSRGYGVF